MIRLLFPVCLLISSRILVQCAPQGFRVTKLREMAHEEKPFTQGLELFAPGQLVETSGSYPFGTSSFIRVLDLVTGRVLNQTTAGVENYFVEGITRSGDGWLATTYLDGKAAKYDRQLNKVAELDFPTEGWGFSRSHDDSKFFATNGSAFVLELDPETLALQRAIPARCLGKDIPGLNELEMVDNFFGLGPTLLGNVYRTRLVIGLDTVNFECNSVFHLDDLERVEADEGSGFHVANGITYLPDSGNLLVTGKNWDSIYEISLAKDDGASSEAVSKLRSWLSPGFLQVSRKTLSQIPDYQGLPSNSVLAKAKRHRSLHASGV
eukprot:TRINITY_DN4491_c0_g2_i1.p1 TRINITY_DN4491_c0_g2~~TRINITY_DN4491_c0_g2_i1.p1  ORF type:complete len:322 (-),score=52.31 TRINITY_DN4491_c0_g2_i1:466-1431(-)